MPVAAEVAVSASQDLLEGHLGVDIPGDCLRLRRVDAKLNTSVNYTIYGVS
jgi:hypothetical protein